MEREEVNMDFIFVFFLGILGVSIGSIAFYLGKKIRPVQRKRIQKATEIVDDMFLSIPKTQIKLMFVIGPLLFALSGFLLLNNIWAAVIGVFLGFVFPTLILRIMIAMRRRAFLDQLVDTLYVISSALKAGMTLQQAFEIVVDEMPSPTSDEFKLILRQVKMGVPTTDALMTLRKRIKSEDVDIVVISVLVARDTGGNVTDVFNSLTNAMREKKRIAKRVMVLTAQARLQTIIITVLPLFFVPIVCSQNPHHFDIFFTDPVGQALIVYAIFSQIMGILVMSILGKVEV